MLSLTVRIVAARGGPLSAVMLQLHHADMCIHFQATMMHAASIILP